VDRERLIPIAATMTHTPKSQTRQAIKRLIHEIHTAYYFP